MADRLWKTAEGDLCVQVGRNQIDPVVWEHARRVARLSEAIASMPDVGGGTLDVTALTVAALYQDAGWVVQFNTGDITAQQLLLRPTSDIQLELAADWILQRLKDIVPPASLQLAARAIRSTNNRQTDLLEAQIVAEADNLDQIGPQAFAMILRKQQAEGKTLDDLVAAWQRQEEYHYWQARIKECFRFASVRAVAERRWHTMRRYMADLQAALTLEDLTTPDASASPSSSPSEQRI